MTMKKEKAINSINLNNDTDFPYLVLDVDNDVACPQNPGFQVMHWHEDLQFIYVLSGTAKVRTLDQVVQIAAGEGLFINRNVILDVGRLGSCHYKSFLFPAYFLEFYTGSPVNVFVDRIVNSTQLPLFLFNSEVSWCGPVLSVLQKLTALEKHKTEYYAAEVLVCLSEMGLTMIKNMTLAPDKTEYPVKHRMQKMLKYIEQHYAEDLTLADLASSAGISKSECSRCFRLTMNTTPYQYLIDFRCSKAALLLKNTSESIGNIAADTGFHQISHFGKCFREKTGYSPRAFREKETGIQYR